MIKAINSSVQSASTFAVVIMVFVVGASFSFKASHLDVYKRQGVRSHSGVAAKMFGALANAGINTEMVTTSEIRITAMIDEAYADQAMRAIHEKFLE